MNRGLLAAGVLGATAVALGAWAEHGLAGTLVAGGFEGEALARRVDNFQTGARYQLATALALLALSVAAAPLGKQVKNAAGLLTAGGVLFSGLLYALALGPVSVRWLGAVVPLGGLAMIGGWSLLAWVGCRKQAPPGDPVSADLVRLEELLTHQQQLWQDLDEVVTSLRNETDKTALRLYRLEEAARQLIDTQRSAEETTDERPPHY
ncbi:SlyX family protein [Botrimarina hoheduenensis]|uniref:DUF423 domain-containing protein n=1 Tax=Botrimarina hoheduenensis TaxID=2528000 RepID=A0A5C5WEE3_9BACT|nr:SlyX family protein [Botrimarina hoheduenensis]TWT48439.1 hypothetical protein Pla111_02070 [Botrimarina hoheduenensis]